MSDQLPPPPPPQGPGGSTAPPGYQTYPQYLQPQHQMAGFGARLGGLLIDGLIIGLPGAIVGYALIFAGFAGCSTRSTTFGSSSELSCSGGSVGLIVLGYLVLLLSWILLAFFVVIRPIAHGRQTPGMKVAGTLIIDAATGQPVIGYGRSWGRYLMASFISGAVCYLGYLWMLWDERNQTWQDLVAKTLVVKTG